MPLADPILRKARFRNRREQLITKLGGKCLICGFEREQFESSRDPFNFHHLNHQFTHRTLYYGQLLKDIDRHEVVLLCTLCHRAVSRVKYWKRIGRLEVALAVAKTSPEVSSSVSERFPFL